MRGRRSSLLTFLILALVAYSAWQMYSLKREVAALRAEVSAMKAGDVCISPNADMLSLVTEARQHIDKAKNDMAGGKIDDARVELEKSLLVLQSAVSDAGSSSGESMDRVRTLIRDMRSTIESLWREMEKQSQDSKGG